MCPTKVAGINTPMTYFGTAYLTFGAQNEDADLMSINYHHHGYPKEWVL